MKAADADRLLRFARVSRPLAQKAAGLTAGDDPGTPAHAERLVGHWRREVAPLAAVPGLGGRLSLFIVEVLAATAQGLLVLSLTEVADTDDERERVRLVAAHALGEKLPRRWSPATASDPGDPDDEDSALWQRTLQAAPGAVFSSAREMWALRRLVGGRTRGGRWWLKGLRLVPVAGALAALLAERDALEKVARATVTELGLDRSRAAA